MLKRPLDLSAFNKTMAEQEPRSPAKKMVTSSLGSMAALGGSKTMAGPKTAEGKELDSIYGKQSDLNGYSPETQARLNSAKDSMIAALGVQPQDMSDPMRPSLPQRLDQEGYLDTTIHTSSEDEKTDQKQLGFGTASESNGSSNGDTAPPKAAAPLPGAGSPASAQTTAPQGDQNPIQGNRVSYNYTNGQSGIIQAPSGGTSQDSTQKQDYLLNLQRQQGSQRLGTNVNGAAGFQDPNEVRAQQAQYAAQQKALADQQEQQRQNQIAAYNKQLEDQAAFENARLQASLQGPSYVPNTGVTYETDPGWQAPQPAGPRYNLTGIKPMFDFSKGIKIAGQGGGLPTNLPSQYTNYESPGFVQTSDERAKTEAKRIAFLEGIEHANNQWRGKTTSVPDYAVNDKTRAYLAKDKDKSTSDKELKDQTIQDMFGKPQPRRAEVAPDKELKDQAVQDMFGKPQPMQGKAPPDKELKDQAINDMFGPSHSIRQPISFKNNRSDVDNAQKAASFAQMDKVLQPAVDGNIYGRVGATRGGLTGDTFPPDVRYIGEGRNGVLRPTIPDGADTRVMQERDYPSLGELGATSDEREKTSKEPLSDKDQLTKMLDALDAYEFNYKNPGAPGQSPGRKVGVMAQDLEKSEIGKQAVMDTPHGKMVDFGKLIPVTLAGLVVHHEGNKQRDLRLDEIEDFLKTMKRK